MRIAMVSAALLLWCAPAMATQVREIKTPGGITAWLVEEHAQPLIAVRVAFRGSGFAHDPDGKEGRTAMTAALLMEGAGDKDAEAFNNALETHAARLAISADEDMVQAALDTLSEHKEFAFGALGQALTAPRFDDGAIARVREQTRSAIAQQDTQPAYRLQRSWQRAAFGAHPYGKPDIGTKESILRLEKADFQFVAAHYLTRENMIVSVVGDISESELSHLLDTQFASLPARYAPDVTVTDTALPAKASTDIIAQDIPQTLVMFGASGIARNDPDYFSAYVMNYLLGGSSLTSRLGVEIRDKRGLAYAIGTQLSPMQHAASWQGSFSTRNEKVGEAIDTLKNTLRAFTATPPDEAALRDAKHFLTGSFVLNLDSNAAVANFLLSMQLYHLGIDYLDTRNAKIEAVTAQQVHAMAQRLIAPDRLLVVMVGNPTLPKDATP